MYKLKLVLKIQKTIGTFRTQTSETEIFHENSQRPRAANYFQKKAPSPMLDQTLNTPLDY